jgi:hypothetical protein
LGLRVFAVVGLLVLALVVAGVLVVGPRRAYALLPLTVTTTCSPVEVDVSAAPAAAPTVRQALTPLQGEDVGGGQCLRVVVSAQDPAGTVAGSAVLPPDRAPDVWIPDSSVWIPRITNWRLQRVASLASTPVVLATSRQASVALGWAQSPPTWAQALSGRRAVALANVDQNATGLAALIAFWQSSGRSARAEETLIGMLYAGARGQLPTAGEVITAAQSGRASAPLIAISEQAIFVANGGNADPNLVAVYPRDGSPVLDFPIVRSQATTRPAAEERGVDLVLARLTSAQVREIAARDGFRSSLATGPDAGGLRRDAVQAIALPPAGQIMRLLSRIEIVSRPSRILAVIDVSQSMSAPVPRGTTRIRLAAVVATSAADAVANTSSGGMWIFARGLRGGQDWRQISPVEPLGATDAGGRSHRDTLKAAISRLPDLLAGGGTGLYDTTLAAVRSVRAAYDPSAINAVAIFTDGANEKTGGLSLDRLISTLRAEADPRRPVLVFGVGVGPDADLTALLAIADATDGQAFRVASPTDVTDLVRGRLGGASSAPSGAG